MGILSLIKKVIAVIFFKEDQWAWLQKSDEAQTFQ